MNGAEVACLVGNHGNEWECPSAGQGRSRRIIRRLGAHLSERFAGSNGIRVEDKGLSLAVHYRQAADRVAARRIIHEAVCTARGAKVIGGRCVVNVLPSDASHKGTALRRLCSMFRSEAVIYVGDDVTDEFAFRRTDVSEMLAIRVGAKRGSRAAYYLRDQREIDALLGQLLRVRKAVMTAGRKPL